VEDTDTTFGELEREFGIKVAAIVREVTDDKSLAKDVRTAFAFMRKSVHTYAYLTVQLSSRRARNTR
jgi:(p)ppGpp synthase/HD superfamily hydrolase